MFDDATLPCQDCDSDFTFTAGEQEFFSEKGFNNPTRCPDCRAVKKAARRGPREMHTAICGDCNTECEVPFKPTPVEEGGKPVLCKPCFDTSRA